MFFFLSGTPLLVAGPLRKKLFFCGFPKWKLVFFKKYIRIFNLQFFAVFEALEAIKTSLRNYLPWFTPRGEQQKI